MDKEYINRALKRESGAAVSDSERRRYQDKVNNFLKKESGAAISESEMKQYEKAIHSIDDIRDRAKKARTPRKKGPLERGRSPIPNDYPKLTPRDRGALERESGAAVSEKEKKKINSIQDLRDLRRKKLKLESGAAVSESEMGGE